MNVRKGRSGRLTATLGVGALLLTAGCAADGSDVGNDTPDEATSLLIAGSPEHDRNFSPFLPGRHTTTTVIYEPLYVMNTLDGEETPFLASAKEQPDAGTVVFTIRDGVTWSDGEEFTPQDVAFTFELLREYEALDLNGVSALIDTVEVEGQDVVFHLSEQSVPAVDIIQKTMIVPEHIWTDVDDPATYSNEDPVGTGPYVLDEFFENEQTLVRNESYWQGENVVVDELILRAAGTELELVNGGYDWAYSFMSDVEGTWVAAGEDNTYWFPPGGTIALIANNDVAPLDDVNVRLGISHALNRERIAEVAAEGYVDAAGTSGLLLPVQEDWLNPEIPDGGMVDQDADTALDYFAEAGYTLSGDQLVDEAGDPLSIELTTPNGWTDWLRAAVEVEGQLEAIGINVSLNQPQPPAYQQELQNGNFELSMGNFGGTGSIYEDFNTLLSSDFYLPVGTTTTANYQRFSDPEVDVLLDEFRVTLDEDRQREVVHELQSILYEQAPVIPMYYGGLWGLFSEQNFTGWPNEDNPYAAPLPYDANALLILTNLEPVG